MPPKIFSYKFGLIVIDGKRYHKDIIILPDHVIPQWRRISGHLLQAVDIEVILKDMPNILIVGQGAYGRMKISEEICRVLTENNIKLISLPTREACQKYNQLCESNLTAAALHLTC